MDSPAADGMISNMLETRDHDEYIASIQALDRVLTTGRYVIPFWYSNLRSMTERLARCCYYIDKKQRVRIVRLFSIDAHRQDNHVGMTSVICRTFRHMSWRGQGWRLGDREILQPITSLFGTFGNDSANSVR